MKIDRAQTMLTRGVSDVLCLFGDGVAYQIVKLGCFEIGGEEWRCARYSEGYYTEHIGKIMCVSISQWIHAGLQQDVDAV